MKSLWFCEYNLNPETGDIQVSEQNFPDVDEWPHKWNKKVVTWKLVTDTPDIEGRKREERIIKRGLLRWQLRVKNLKFRMLNTKSKRFRNRYGTVPDMLIKHRNSTK